MFIRLQSPILLRTAIGIATVQYLAHAFLFLRGTNPHDGNEAALLSTMKTLHWNFGGSARSYWNFFFGYGLVGILFGGVEIVSLWMVMNVADSHPAFQRKVIITWMIAVAIHAVLVLRYFFLLPFLFECAVVFLLLASFLKTKSYQVT